MDSESGARSVLEEQMASTHICRYRCGRRLRHCPSQSCCRLGSTARRWCHTLQGARTQLLSWSRLTELQGARTQLEQAHRAGRDAASPRHTCISASRCTD